jgi:4-hydroxy-3-methylbut-2-enyl diphosphate reductase
MAHVSELSWQRIKHPSEVLKVGDKAEVYILILRQGKQEDISWLQDGREQSLTGSLKTIRSEAY